ncbi:MAG: DUF2066 domain-containing protein [Pseudomonadales bacterium]|nr:DUF2066 domain-containing protein [Pseudomonadales bacterium]MBO6596062.1 DUF2066 domain-containing protein [Pseudomonadales bacterium]MBO6822545.1 DUF2066 domain-containing protein [Pseudomonadales bacterium]
MNSSRLVPVLFLMLCVYSGPSSALPVDDLYVAKVLVTDEGSSQLRSGARAGLLQVLIRISGSLDVEQSSLIRNSLRNPAAYYYQYSYESTDRTLMIGEEERPAKTLTLHFEPSAVARLLRDANFPVWGSNRPSVLLWFAVSEGQDRRILSEADPSSFVESLVSQASERGVPLLFPILDLEDAARISTAEVWGTFLDRVETASTRYSPDAVLTARIQEEVSGRWSGRWSYQISDGWKSMETVAFSSDELVRNIIDQLANDLAARFALDSSRAKVTLTVEGVADVSRYSELNTYLEQLAPVLYSSIVSLQGDVARFELETEGQVDQLVEIIDLDERLLLLGNDLGNGRLMYRFKE